jgi:hypothetical protein
VEQKEVQFLLMVINIKIEFVKGNHYHRPECKYASDYAGPDKILEKCEECMLSKLLCPKPINLEHGDTPESEKPLQFK